MRGLREGRPWAGRPAGDGVIYERIGAGRVRSAEWYPSRAALQFTQRTGHCPSNMRFVDWDVGDGLCFYVMNAPDDHTVYDDAAVGTSRLVRSVRHRGEPGAYADRLVMDWLCHGVTPTLDGKRGVSPRALMDLHPMHNHWDARVEWYRFRAQVERRKYVVRVDVT